MKKTTEAQFRISHSQHVFLRKRAQKLEMPVSKMINDFINSRTHFVKNEKEFISIFNAMASYQNNIFQIQRAVQKLDYTESDDFAFYRLKEKISSLQTGLKENIEARRNLITVIDSMLEDENFFKKNVNVSRRQKNIILNSYLFLLDEESPSERIKIRMTENEKSQLIALAESLDCSMKIAMLSAVASGNVFTWQYSIGEKLNDLVEHGKLLNSAARMLNGFVKEDKKTTGLDMMSVISDLERIEQYLNENRELYLDACRNIRRKITVNIADEGIYWNSNFIEGLKGGKYGRE